MFYGLISPSFWAILCAPLLFFMTFWSVGARFPLVITYSVFLIICYAILLRIKKWVIIPGDGGLMKILFLISFASLAILCISLGITIFDYFRIFSGPHWLAWLEMPIVASGAFITFILWNWIVAKCLHQMLYHIASIELVVMIFITYAYSFATDYFQFIAH